MNKRDFCAGLGLAAWVPAGMAASRLSSGAGVLTVSGAVGKTNRAALDPVIDQLTYKHGIRFDKAYEFDAAALQALPSVTIEPTLEYDAKRHRLQGPLLATVIDAAGVARSPRTQLHLRAVDGYRAELTLADATAYRMVVATQIDGQPMGVGGFGPQWAVYDPEATLAFKDKPLKERFALCPWGLYHVEVREG